MTIEQLVLIGLIGAASAVLMLLLWLLHLRIGDAGLVDVGWSYSLGGAGVWCALAGDGDVGRRILLACLVGFWGLRLGTHLLVDRVLSSEEDGRYAMLREKLGGRFSMAMLPFFQAQALLVAILAVPFVLAAYADRPFGVLDIAALVVWLIGIVGEAVADMQLRAFKRDPSSKGKTCRRGLWRYSRHPNYFFEWLMWCAYALLALAAPWGWLGLTAPALMLFLVLKVTGIPPTEARAVQSRGEDYRRYQRTTSAFFPWFPKTEDA